MFLNRVAYFALKIFPNELATRFVGYISDARVPKLLLAVMIEAYSLAFGANLGESEKQIPEFATLNEFFTRKLKPGARKIAPSKTAIISPVDGTVQAFGKIDAGKLIQAKGKDYTLEALLSDEPAAKGFLGGSFITIYLHPRDYHRIHAPLSGGITGYQYVPGSLFPVNSLSLNAVDGLFARNERLITYMETRAGKVAVIKVGACLVGRIRASYCGFVAKSSVKAPVKCGFTHKIDVTKGDELGMFELGSTVILLFQKDKIKFGKMKSGERIMMGESIARIST